jgi:hypothetical protein
MMTKFQKQVFSIKDIVFRILGWQMVHAPLLDSGLVQFDHPFANLKVLSSHSSNYYVGKHRAFTDLVLELEGDNYLNLEFETNPLKDGVFIKYLALRANTIMGG